MAGEILAPKFRSSSDLQIDYARELNPQQFAAATALPGPALVIAGAGSGKTRTLTYRVGFLIEQGIPPERILLLTFTNKAAREMMRRVSALLRSDTSGVWGGTFHSIGNRILRRHAERLGLKPDYTILDRDDAERLMKSCFEEAKSEEKGFPKPAVLSEIFSFALNTQTPVSVLLEDRYPYFHKFNAQIADIHLRYQSRKQAANSVDFDDLLWFWWRLIAEHDDVRDYYQRRFQFVLVDEYQDTNKLQSAIIDALGARHRNVTVVGDDAQSIYSWRGANFHNIREFPDRYPNAQIHKIEINYRSTPEILALANAILTATDRRFEKQLTPVRDSGQKPVLAVCSDARQQAAFVAQRIAHLRAQEVPFSEMAVLYRSHFHALELQTELTRQGIPYQITSGMRFFEQAHVKDLVAYLRLLANPQDEIAFKRLALMLPGIGGKAADKLWARFQTAFAQPARQQESQPRRESSTAPEPSKTSAPIATALQACSPLTNKKALVPWTAFLTLIAQLERQPSNTDPSHLLQLIVDNGFDSYLRETYENYDFRREEIDFIIEYARQFTSLEQFLSQLALVANTDAPEAEAESDEKDYVRLSTVHQAKGLEFKAVFVIMLADNLFPTRRSQESSAALDEERRLLYVAVTRAKDELYLSFPQFHRSGGEFDFQELTRFLACVPDDLYEECRLSSW